MKKRNEPLKTPKEVEDYLAEIDREFDDVVAPAGKGIDLKPDHAEDPFVKKLMEDERAFLNPEEWGIDLRPIIRIP